MITSMDPDAVQSPRRGISLVRYEDDHGPVERGSLIPPARKAESRPLVPAHRPPLSLLVVGSMLAAVALLGGVLTVLGGHVSSWRSMPLVAALGSTSESPDIVFQNPFSERLLPPRFGPAPALVEKGFYTDMRERLITGGASFVDVDLTDYRIRYFNKGVLELVLDIEKKPDSTSWCRVAAGFYAVEEVRPMHTSTYLDAVLPESVIFGANLFIHGWPYATDGSPVADDFGRDCIRLRPDAAEKLAKSVRPGTVVVVHEVEEERIEAFAYEAKIPDFTTPYYLIADLKSETVLAVGDKHTPVPIASLTKLMTALVVMENLSLDDTLAIEEPNLIESLVPRLKERARISVYSLLQLLLVESSNEAAEVLAGAVGREEFVALMNERAAELGLIDTVFTDPSGIDSGNVSSVNDLWWLTRYLYLHVPFVFELTAQTDTVPAYVPDHYADLMNFNRIESVESFFGGKVGETEAAKQTSITLHRLPIEDTTRDIAIVLLGSEGRRDDVLQLLLHIEEQFGGD